MLKRNNSLQYFLLRGILGFSSDRLKDNFSCLVLGWVSHIENPRVFRGSQPYFYKLATRGPCLKYLARRCGTPPAASIRHMRRLRYIKILASYTNTSTRLYPYITLWLEFKRVEFEMNATRSTKNKTFSFNNVAVTS